MPFFVVNTAQQVGPQSNSKVVALPDGDFVVAWTNFGLSQATTVWMQRFTGDGVAVGGQVQVFTTASVTELRDIAVSSDGRIWIAGTEGSTVVVKSFNPQTLAATSGQISLASANPPLGVQIDAANAGAGSITVMVSTQGLTLADSQYLTADVTAAGVAAPLTLLTGLPGVSLQAVAEFDADGLTISSNGSTNLAFLGSGAPMTLTSEGRPTDVVQMRPDLYVVSVQNSTIKSVSLQAVVVTPSGGLVSGGIVTGGFGGSTGVTTDGQNVYDAELVRLDNDRVLVVYVSDGGNTFPNSGSAVTDGIYASVYNVANGAVETTSILRNLGNIFNEAELQAISLSATLLADGRVALTYSAAANGNSFWGEDIFADILDLRVAGISVTASTIGDSYLGTAFNDTFTAVSTNDEINGGAGEDTVVFTGATARLVDLASPAAFPESTFVLTSIENLTGGSGADGFYGTSGANKLSGEIGNDTLDGRGGADLLSGGTGNDRLFGAAGADTLTGDSDDDSLYGGADNDLMLGGTGNDLMSAGAGDDAVFGNDGNDQLYGDAGNDQMDGGAGGDYIDGGVGDDWIQGGLGNDTIRAQLGADSLMGDAGNDRFIADTTVAAVDGGDGTDTLIVFIETGDEVTLGIYADLSGGSTSFSNLHVLQEFTGVISGVENLTGSSGNDMLIGSAGVNVLRGSIGADSLVGLEGNDTLSGGAGSDTFIFLSPTHGNDRITDFTTSVDAGADKLALSADAFGDLASADLLTRLTINATGTVAANANAQLLFDNSGAGAGRLFFDADGNGVGAAVLFATLTFTTPAGLAGFSASDFMFI